MNVSVVLDIYSKFHHLINTLIVPFLAPNETYALSHWTHLNDVFYHERNEILHDIISISRCFWSNRNVNGIYRTKAIPLDGRVDLCEFQWNWIDKKKIKDREIQKSRCWFEIIYWKLEALTLFHFYLFFQLHKWNQSFTSVMIWSMWLQWE